MIRGKIKKIGSLMVSMIMVMAVFSVLPQDMLTVSAAWSSVSDLESYALKNWVKPINASYLDINSGSRYFGADRSGTTRKHAANDYVCDVGTPVYAMTGGYVEEYSSNFYGGTQAISVKNDDGSVARYCEISTSLRSGNRVEKGQQIGTVIANNIGGGHMLHLEMYLGTGSGSLTNTSNSDYWYVSYKNYCRRQDLIDPSFVQNIGNPVPDNDDELGIPYPRPTGSPLLKSGSTGSGVSWLQTALNKASNAGLSVDGQFGSSTKSAVTNFQSANGLDADGIAGPATISKLVEVIKNGAAAEMIKPVISKDKSAYNIGDAVYLSWAASPANSNLSHYWLTIVAPDGSTLLNETMNKNTSYSFTVSQAGNYIVTAFATPNGSTDGSGSLTDEVTVTVNNSSYTVSFYNYSNSYDVVSSKTVTYGSTYGTLPTLTRDGYDFDGWYTATSGGVKITSSSIVNTESDHSLYAHWIIKSNAPSYPVADYYADLNFDGKFSVFDISVLQEIAESENPTAIEWIYADLNGDGVVNGDDSTIISRIYTHTINDSIVQAAFAKWKARYIDTTYIIVPENADYFELSVKQGHQYASLPVPEKAGYTFTGWYTDKGVPITSSSVFIETDYSEPLIGNYFCIKANWQVNSYTVYFDSQGGSCSTSKKSVTYSSTYGSLPVPTRTGYTFDGWYTSPSGKGTKVISSTTFKTDSNQMLYANWTANRYSISYVTNAPCGFGTITRLVYGSTYGQCLGELPVPTYKGYEFDGWYTEETGGERITEDSVVTVTEDQTLYAHWTSCTYGIAYDTQSPYSAIATTKKIIYGYTYGECLGELPVPKYRGYEFDGWYTEPDGGEKITEDTVVTVRQDQTLYGHWTSIQYNIDFETQAPCDYATTNKIIYGLTYGECLGKLPVFEIDGLIFDGWYTEPEGGERITENTVVTVKHDQTLYGHWYTYNKGDANNDGEVSVADAVMLQKWLSRTENLTCWKNVDLDEDGKINVFDMCLLRQMILNPNN